MCIKFVYILWILYNKRYDYKIKNKFQFWYRFRRSFIPSFQRNNITKVTLEKSDEKNFISSIFFNSLIDCLVLNVVSAIFQLIMAVHIYIYIFLDIQICTAWTVYVVTNKMVCMTSSSENITVTNRIATISE